MTNGTHTDTRQSVSVETAKEVVRLSELYIDGTIRLSLAADARALSITGTLATGATVLIGFGLAGLSNVSRLPLAISALSGGLILFVAMGVVARTIRPREFNIVGTLRSKWSSDELVSDLAPALMSLASVYETQAMENIKSLSVNAKQVRLAYDLLAAAVPVALFAGAVTYVIQNGLPTIAN